MANLIITPTLNASLPMPPLDAPAGYEEYVLQVSMMHQENRRIYRLGSIILWKTATGLPLGADELILWCPQPGCMGAILPSYSLSDEDTERIEKLKEVYTEAEAAAEIDPSLWPEDIQKRINNHWYEKIRCPVCFQEAPRQSFASDYNFRDSFPRIAQKVAEVYRTMLHSSASILLVRHKRDMLYHRVQQALSERQGFNRTAYEKLLKQARDREQTTIYRSRQIAADVSTGRTLSACIQSFLQS